MYVEPACFDDVMLTLLVPNVGIRQRQQQIYWLEDGLVQQEEDAR